MNYPHIIETAVLLLFAFLLGALIGYFVRSLMVGPGKGTDRAEEGSGTQEGNAAAQAPVTAPLATSVPPAATVAPPPVPDSAVTNSAASGEKAAKPAGTSNKPAGQAKKASGAGKKAPAKPRARKAAKATAKSTPASSESPSASSQAKPQGLDAPRGGTKDDLKRIKGVGPKIESTLNGMGIYHFDQIAGWGRAEVEWVDENLSFKGRIDREKWVEQAKALS